ncbi:hypothetical protein COLO4_35956 [Corchorus olitorius]|uniref:Uncharacterized protein n=1 Tax=Corchorus olitorius TaxID=93759 RepID=A0A1R3GBN2_9ROSI|nr:hypothetical protein COLO4_35956 [Corchorus olitorius]
MSQSGSSNQILDEVSGARGTPLDERRSAGGEGLLVGDAGEAVVGGSGGASIVEPPDSDEDSEDSLASESRVDEAVLLDFGAPPSVLREQIKTYHKYCRAKFAECGIKKRAGGWYAFQFVKGLLGVSPLEINSSERNDPKGEDLSKEEKEHVDYLQRVRHSSKDLCHRTRLYLCGLAPLPDAYPKMPTMDMGTVGPLAFGGIRMIVNARGDEGREFMIGESEEDYVDYTVFNLINGRLEADPNAIVPKASPELIDEELDPGIRLMAFVTGGCLAGLSSPLAIDAPFPFFFVDQRGGGAYADPPDYLFLLPMDKADKAAFKEAVKARMGEKKKSGQQNKSQGKKRSAEPIVASGGAPAGGASKGVPSSSGKDASSRGDRHGHVKHSANPSRNRDKTNLDFLCNLMTRCLKVGDSKETETVEALEDDECAASIAVCAHKEKKARKDAQRLHGLLEKKYTDLCAKFSKLEKENSTLTSDYASLKKARDDDAATHTMFRIQMEKDLEDLRIAECEKKEVAHASAVADAADVAQDLADEARQELLKSIKEAHPELDLSAFECAAEGEAEEELGEESSPSLVAGETEPAAIDRGGEVVDLTVTHVVIPSSEQLFTTDDLFDGLQVDIAQSKEIADQIFAENGDESIANVGTVPTSSQAPKDLSAERQGDGEDAS